MSADTTAAKELRGYLERIERLESVRKDAADDIADVYKELAGRGFDKDAAKVILKIRRTEGGVDAWTGKSQTIDMYLSALGMLPEIELAPAPARVHGNIEEFPPHNPETGEITDTQEQPETVEQTSPAPTRKTAGSAPRNEGSEGANTEHDDVDGSTERAGHAGQPFDALTGQVETRTSEKIVERNTSGPDAKRATHSPETASQSEPVTPGPSSLAAREADESAAPIPPSAVTPPAADKTGAAPLPSNAAPVELTDDDVPAFLKSRVA